MGGKRTPEIRCPSPDIAYPQESVYSSRETCSALLPTIYRTQERGYCPMAHLASNSQLSIPIGFMTSQPMSSELYSSPKPCVRNSISSCRKRTCGYVSWSTHKFQSLGERKVGIIEYTTIAAFLNPWSFWKSGRYIIAWLLFRRNLQRKRSLLRQNQQEQRRHASLLYRLRVRRESMEVWELGIGS